MGSVHTLLVLENAVEAVVNIIVKQTNTFSQSEVTDDFSPWL